MVAMDWTEKKTFHVPSVGVGLRATDFTGGMICPGRIFGR